MEDQLKTYVLRIAELEKTVIRCQFLEERVVLLGAEDEANRLKFAEMNRVLAQWEQRCNALSNDNKRIQEFTFRI